MMSRRTSFIHLLTTTSSIMILYQDLRDLRLSSRPWRHIQARLGFSSKLALISIKVCLRAWTTS